MLYEEHLSDFTDLAYLARCDQCVAGHLRHPQSGLPIQKGTQVLTTSTIMYAYLSKLRCPLNHQHESIAGSCHDQTGRSMNLSSFTELYTATFGQRIAKTIQASKQVHERSVVHEQGAFHNEDEPEPKRRRLWIKTSPEAEGNTPEANMAPRSLDEDRTLPQDYHQILQQANQMAPRVGKMILEQGPLFDAIQKLCPGHQVRVVELCKGTDRYRKPPIKLTAGEAPLRCCFGLHRHSLEPTEFCDWVNWETMSNNKMISKSPPTRLLVTVFARKTDSFAKRSHKQMDSADDTNHSKKARVLAPADDQQPTPNETHQPPPSNLPDECETEQTAKHQHTSDQHQDDATTPQQPTPKHTTHGPKFLALDKSTQQWLSKIHHNLGHPSNQKLQAVLTQQGYDQTIVNGLSDFQCSTCHELQLPKISRPAHLSSPREFNECVGCDLITWTNGKGKNFQFLHVIDVATNFQQAIPVYRTDAQALFEAFQSCWLHWAGPCDQLVIDNASALCSDQFAALMQGNNIHLRVVASYAHWQMGKVERRGDILQHMLQKFDHDQNISTDDHFRNALYHSCSAKNSLSRVKGYTPEILVLGKSAKLPGSLCDDEFHQPAQYLADSDSAEGLKFRANLQYRECARKAFISADHNEQLRRAFLRRQRPHRGTYQGGSFVMFWRPGRGELPGQWHGPAQVIIQESQSIIWISFSSRVYRVAPEHVRTLSEREACQMGTDVTNQSIPDPPKDTRSGVFQYEDLTEQVTVPPAMMPDNPPITNPNNHNPPSTISDDQPDAEPAMIPESNPDDYSPTTPLSDHSQPNTTENIPTEHPNPPAAPEDIPVPESSDDENLHVEDYWIHQGQQIMRVHRKPRTEAFDPSSVADCPVDILTIMNDRCTTGNFGDAPIWSKMDEWGKNEDRWIAPKPWTGITMFTILNDEDINCEVNTCEDILHVEEHQALEYTIFFTQDDLDAVSEHPTEFLTLAASAAKRQRAEVKIKDLSSQERKEFDKAKGKEIDQWLATETVRKILRNRIPEQNILRCRWVLTWKDLDPQDAAIEGKNRKAKARLVILGYEDPNICDIPRDSPTLQKESRSLLLQMCASRKLTIRSFDIKTAFLRGSRRDNRILGVDPPSELRDRLNLQDDEICELLKSAYGLVNAPYLWYQELCETLLSLGFTISPLDPCLFVLADDHGRVHGAVGMHVDDGLCFGDSKFDAVLQRLEQKFPFGSKREVEFTFTGLHLKQDQHWNIHIDQTEYIQAIEPVHIDRNRRKDEQQEVLESERQQLRGVIGSLQYAATNSRPDIAARLSFLQSKINSARIGDLLEANRLLGDAKRHAQVGITISSIPEESVRLVSYSDASFASRAKQQSQKGGLFIAVHQDTFLQKTAMASPLTWYSKKIDRVVASTLAAETYALSSAVDMTDWLRLMWAWLRNPRIPWQQPEKVWKSEPPSIAVVDCKSLYDVITKNTTPQCQEHRTLIEALVIKHHIQHGIKPHWVHSAAQLADCLTKVMDAFRLREFLNHRTCCLHDVEEVLKQRADHKAQKTWLTNAANRHAAGDISLEGIK